MKTYLALDAFLKASHEKEEAFNFFGWMVCRNKIRCFS